MAEPDDDFAERTITIRAPAGARPELLAHMLLVVPEDAPPRRVPLHTTPLTIGRVPPADLVLEGGTVSRRHCRLERQDDRIVLTDLASTNGTFVNGVRIAAPTLLDDGAHIAVGVYTIVYRRCSQHELLEWEAQDRELREASDYVLSILPQPLVAGPVQADWFYQPSARLGGDAFGYQMLDSRCFAAFLLDVAGHGAGAALHAVTVANVLRQRMLPGVEFRDPGAVIRGLNRTFAMERYNNQFFTMWYGVYDMAERELRYATAGQHPAFLLPPGTAQPMPLGTNNPSIGIAADREMATARTTLPPGSRLFLFSDGVFEIVDRDGRQWELGQVLSLLPRLSGPRQLYDAVRAAARPGPLDDDFSALMLSFA